MPLKGFQSLCNKHAARIVSKDEGNPQCHKGNNIGKAYVTHYKIDGVVITKKERCDYLLINEETHTAYLIEGFGFGESGKAAGNNGKPFASGAFRLSGAVSYCGEQMQNPGNPDIRIQKVSNSMERTADSADGVY